MHTKTTPRKLKWSVGRGELRVGASTHREPAAMPIVPTVLSHRILPLPPGINKLSCRGARAKGNLVLAGRKIGSYIRTLLKKTTRDIYRVNAPNIAQQPIRSISNGNEYVSTMFTTGSQGHC